MSATRIPFTVLGLLRAIVFSAGQILLTIFFSLTGLLLFAFPLKVRYAYITIWSRMVIGWARLICGIDYRVKGRENLPVQNAIVLCKHQSAWETLFLQCLLPTQTWVLKKELLMIPFFGWGLALLQPIAIDRKKSSAIHQLLAQGKKRLSQGRWVVIFPEGTRVPVGEIGKYSKSGALLSKDSGYPIVPIALNAGVFWPKDSFFKRSGTINVVIGPTIYPADLTVDEILKRAKDWIESTMRNLPQA